MDEELITPGSAWLLVVVVPIKVRRGCRRENTARPCGWRELPFATARGGVESVGPAILLHGSCQLPTTGQHAGRSCGPVRVVVRSEEHTSELQSHLNLVCRLLLEKKK